MLTSAEYWDRPEMVSAHQTEPFLHWYERYLVERAAQLLTNGAHGVRLIHVIGCGPGREIPPIHAAFPNSRIIASDISRRMIEACVANLKRWKCATVVQPRCQPASTLRSDGELADVVFMLNNVLTYVTPESERRTTLGALRALLHPGGIIAGSVHHRWGRPAKTAFFLAQPLGRMLRRTSGEPGDRTARTPSGATRFHYFTSTELYAALREARFDPETVLALSALGRQLGRRYNPWTGSNLLIFAARAR